MSDPRFLIRKAAVLGAGVMGSQIAAHLANANVPVILFDLAAKEGDPNGIVQRAIDNLAKLEPSPLATRDKAAYIDAANYDEHLSKLTHRPGGAWDRIWNAPNGRITLGMRIANEAIREDFLAGRMNPADPGVFSSLRVS